MSFERVSLTGPEIVTLSELKAQLRIDHEAEDDNLALFLSSARELIEKETGFILQQGQFILKEPLKFLRTGNFLSLTPIISMTTQGVILEDGTFVGLADEVLRLDLNQERPQVWFDNLPEAASHLYFDVIAGFSGIELVPAPLKLASLTLASSLYHNSLCQEGAERGLPSVCSQLIDPFRWRLL